MDDCLLSSNAVTANLVLHCLGGKILTQFAVDRSMVQRTSEWASSDQVVANLSFHSVCCQSRVASRSATYLVTCTMICSVTESHFALWEAASTRKPSYAEA